MTCYMIFYVIHPLLNNIIEKASQNKLFRGVICLSVMYIFAGVIITDLFFPSMLTLWITIYFIIAYIKRYMINLANSMKINFIVFGICLIFFVGTVLITEFLGMYINFLSDKMLHWVNSCNPLLIGMAITAFNIARNIHFKNIIVNYLSSLSLLIYIIHENLILRIYY